MKGRDTLMSSKSDNWGTPQALFDRVHAYFHFDLDLAADEANRKCDKYLSEEDNALSVSWHEHGRSMWCNPPYSLVDKFINHAVLQLPCYESAVFLVPSRTDTKWWQKAYKHASGVYFIKGRIKFVGEGSQSAPFPSCLLVFGVNEFLPPEFERREGRHVDTLELTKEQRGL